MSFLEIKHLSKSFGKKQILKDVSFSINPGQVVAFLGPNGAGKTTLLKTMIGLYGYDKSEQSSAQILFDGINILDWPVYKRVEQGMVYLPQQTSLLQQLTVYDNLQIVFEYQAYWKNIDKAEFIKERDHWLEITGLQETLNQKAGTLSGGQKRKLEVVRSMLMHPRLIILDEPFAGVDPKSIYELKKIFVDTSQQGIAILISDHNVDQLLSIAQLVYVFINGQIVTSGGVKEIIENKLTKEHYLGNQFYNEITQRYS
ncbi:MAG: ABC-type (Unclassified) transport system, ATPase component [candidate division TM6 bacterium GW2011_GWF2_37_49]|nr:MAG: ABC-type (Unclassified) transport system, ATPase component [candidate division TM6 bacterium GW2011_GWF2_37_49]